MIFFYLLVAVMPLVSHPLLGNFIGALTVTKYIGIASMLYAVWYGIRRGFMREGFRSPLLMWFLLLFIMASVSYLWKGIPVLWYMSPLFTYISFLFLFFVIVSLVDTLPRLRMTLLVAIASMAIASLYVIREWQKYHNLYPGFRPGYVTGDPNYFSLSAVACLPIAYYFMREGHTNWERIYSLGCFILILVAFMLAASRGGFIGLVAALLCVVWQSKQRLRNLAVLGALLLPLMLLMPDSPVTRFLHPSYADEVGKTTRLELWAAGLRMIKQHPLTGVGLGNFKPLVRSYAASDIDLNNIAHNTYIEYAAEMGIPTLAVFLIILGISFRSLRRILRDAGPRTPGILTDAAQGIYAGLVGVAVAILFLSAERQKFLWMLVFLTPCLESLAGEVQQAEPPGDTPPDVEDDAADFEPELVEADHS